MSVSKKSGIYSLDDNSNSLSDPNTNNGLSFQAGGFAATTTAVGATIAGTNFALYLTEQGNSSAINVGDINQGQIGDCYLLSSIGEEALFHPTAISNMIHDNGNGTQTVTLYGASNGALLTAANFRTAAFKPIQVTVTDQFPTYAVNDYSRAMQGGLQEIWPQVIEKAYAQLYGGYNVIGSGGYPFIAMEALTGQAATWATPSTMTLSQLQSYVSQGDLLTFDTTGSNSLPYGLVGGHAYMFESLTTQNGATTLTLHNPWGSVPWAGSTYKEDVSIPVSVNSHGQLTSLASAGIVEIDIGRPMAST